jgi:hypothetical protein
MHEEIYLTFLGILGVAIHHLKDWVKANRLGKQYELKKSIPTILLSVISTWVLVHLRFDIETLYVVTPFGALVLGYIGNSVLFSFIDAKKPKTDDDV